jgi:hypothetical protein
MVDKSILLGLGLDCEDGHLRITKGKNFRLYGGSQETHKVMQEKAIKFNEQLDRCGKTMGEITVKEFYDIAHRIGLIGPDEIKEDKKSK